MGGVVWWEGLWRGFSVGGAVGMKWEGLQGVRLSMTLHPISETSASVEAVSVAR